MFRGRLLALVEPLWQMPRTVLGTERMSTRAVRLQLFLTSFVILFFELACIRWIPAYVRFLSYFMNFILLASFLGIGVGILAGRRKVMPLPPFPVLLFVLVVVVARNRFALAIPSTQVLFFAAGERAVTPESFVVLPLLVTLVALAFVPLSAPLGRLLTARPPLEVYAIDVIGSMAGVAVFYALSHLSAPPGVWFLVISLAYLPLIRLPAVLAALPLFIAVVATGFQMARWDTWSPYYRIQIVWNETDGYLLAVNNTGHQEMRPYRNKESFYFLPYDLLGHPPFERVLIIGAGSGSDAAIALARGARHVDAVEIDPEILAAGRKMHPDKPYDSPHVTTHVADGRAFLRRDPQRYDLIVFALPDSLTLTSAFSSMRLESFLFTVEAIRSAREHLRDDGLLVLYNYYRHDWLVRKLAGMVEEAFGEPPFVTSYGAWGRAAVIMAGPRLDRLPPDMDKAWRPLDRLPIREHGYVIPVLGQGRLGGDPRQALATDDWPLVYMQVPTIPRVYLGALGILAVVAGALMILLARGALRSFRWHFFFLGAAFMLLETRSLVTFSLLFGSTSMVNSLVFFAILASVLLAILWNARHPEAAAGRWVYLALFATLLLNLAVPPRLLLAIPTPALRYFVASALTFAPIFLANVVFSRSFRATAAPDVAFASNLIGIMVGGMLEYTALATGYQALLILVIIFYALARVPKTL